MEQKKQAYIQRMIEMQKQKENDKLETIKEN